MKSRLAQTLVLLAFVLLSAVTGEGLARLLPHDAPTLLDRRNWVVSKTRLAMHVPGADPYFTDPRALAGGHLHLEAWHGYQEVVLRHALTPERVRCRVFLEPGAYVYLAFNRLSLRKLGFDDFDAVRLSLAESMPSAFVRVRDGGRFDEYVPLTLPALRAGRWNDVSVRFTGENAVLTVNGAETALPVTSMGAQHIAFRGGARMALVDDLHISQADGRLDYREPFDNSRARLRHALVLAALVLLAHGVAALVLRRVVRDWRPRVAVLLSASVCAAAVAVSLGVFRVHVQRDAYPALSPEMQRREDAFVRKQAEHVVAQLDARHPPACPPDTTRILYLGTSQTWGSGAAREEDCFVRRIEDMLNAGRGEAPAFECVKAAVPGADSSLLLELHAAHWAGLGQALTVVNLSVNDKDTEVLADNLRALALDNAARGIRTVLVAEPVSPEEAPDGAEEQRALHTVAAEMGLPLIDLHRLARERVNDGILWWDVVHPTTYGHRLLAELLFPTLLDLVARGE